MEEIKLSDDVIKQIKKFPKYYSQLTKQKTLIDKLILNEELKERYKRYGLCNECKQPNTGHYINGWCLFCNGKRFQQNFENWTSGNHEIDELIQEAQLNAKSRFENLEWIEYDGFENIEYLAEGGFGTTYKATCKDGFIQYWDSGNNRWKRENNKEGLPVALKCLHNSQGITAEFLSEIKSHITVGSDCVVRCYGITKDPATNNFMMVMDYAPSRSLRQYLNNKFNELSWRHKLYNLYLIANGLSGIHSKKLIHRDFHCGSIDILIYTHIPYQLHAYIAGLRLCKPANEKSENLEKRIYGVLPYVAPEVLRGKEYTQESDIYGFGIIAYELCTGYPPYHDIDHDESLAIRICNGQRPNSNYKIPQLILDIIIQCWDADPLKRPKAEMLKELFWNLWNNSIPIENSALYKQIKKADEINKNLPKSSSLSGTLSYTTHPQAIYTSRLLDFKNLPEPKNSDNDNLKYSGSTKIDFTKFKIEE